MYKKKKKKKKRKKKKKGKKKRLDNPHCLTERSRTFVAQCIVDIGMIVRQSSCVQHNDLQVNVLIYDQGPNTLWYTACVNKSASTFTIFFSEKQP